MGKKKKAAARLPQQWADAADAEKTALRDRAQSTAKKALSRRQRRAAAAGWGDSSPEQEAPASAPPRPRPGGLRLQLGGDDGGSESGEERNSQVSGPLAMFLACAQLERVCSLLLPASHLPPSPASLSACMCPTSLPAGLPQRSAR